MDSDAFFDLIVSSRKESDLLRKEIPLALKESIDPANFVMDAIARVFPVDRVKERAKKIAESWKLGMEQRGGVENAKAQDVHAFLQHLVTFGIGVKEERELYMKLVVNFSRRKQMPKLATSLGLEDKMSASWNTTADPLFFPTWSSTPRPPPLPAASSAWNEARLGARLGLERGSAWSEARPGARLILERGSAWSKARPRARLGLEWRSTTDAAACSRIDPELLSRPRRQARDKGNDVSTWAGEALSLHVCMEAPLHQWVREGIFPTG
ncbi:hypothetical protein KSP40_PGU001355 [Platanthera guangdongensis]|uniref:FRIGIDA-like protein n=1 Tax=Platanthera guangdongensis TaxID=2320717 RepID=A0ABR2M9B1_9ASPA